MLRGIIADRQQFKRRERTEDQIHPISFDQFLGLRSRPGRVAAGIGDDQLGGPSGKLIVPVPQEQFRPLFH